MSWSERYASEDHYKYIKKQGDSWVILQKGTGKVLSHHDSRKKAMASLKAMIRNKHGSAEGIGALELAHELGITLNELQGAHSLLSSRGSVPKVSIKDDSLLSPEHADTLRQYARQSGIARSTEGGVDGPIHTRESNVLWDW